MDRVIGILQSVRAHRDSSISDRMSYYYTTMWLGILSVFTLGWSFVGQPIQCWFPAYYKGFWIQYALDYCFVQNTYFLPMMDAPARNYWELGQQLVQIPQNVTEREDRLIGYYQWVGFFLAIEGIMFYLPVVIWRSMYSLTGVKVETICETLTNAENLDKGKRSDNVKKVARFLDQSIDVLKREKQVGASRTAGFYLTALYLFIKVLFVVNVVIQYLLLRQFLGAESHFWGIEVLQDLMKGLEWQETAHFPRVTMCDFEVRVLGNLHRHTVQCVLMINMFNEKIFLFLWWWFMIVGVVSILSLLYWLFALTFGRSGVRLVRSYIDRCDPPTDRDYKDRESQINGFCRDCLASDGLLLLQLASTNSGDLVANEVVEAMWNSYKESKEHPPPPRITAEPNSLHAGATNGAFNRRRKDSFPGI